MKGERRQLLLLLKGFPAARQQEHLWLRRCSRSRTRRNSEFQRDIVSPPSLSESFLVTTAEVCTSAVAEQKKKKKPTTSRAASAGCEGGSLKVAVGRRLQHQNPWRGTRAVLVEDNSCKCCTWRRSLRCLLTHTCGALESPLVK